jgi:hypothetical protein
MRKSIEESLRFALGYLIGIKPNEHNTECEYGGVYTDIFRYIHENNVEIVGNKDRDLLVVYGFTLNVAREGTLDPRTLISILKKALKLDEIVDFDIFNYEPVETDRVECEEVQKNSSDLSYRDALLMCETYLTESKETYTFKDYIDLMNILRRVDVYKEIGGAIVREYTDLLCTIAKMQKSIPMIKMLIESNLYKLNN